ncbi:MAG: NAD-dependent malic enzyme [Mesosutterella sp.]|nr:NAD-dependent malic enzyme [Mesosutterella sp.]
MACQTLKGAALLQNGVLSKGTAYTEQERAELGLRGLLPPVPSNIRLQAEAMIEQLRSFDTPYQKALFLDGLRAANETLFFRLVMDYVEEILPLVYTPTVGEVCQKYSHLYRFPRGLFLSIEDKGHLDELIANAPQQEVDMIVVTDGQRILGLGDLGVNGMGIPVGKLGLYTACAGVDPRRTLPVTLDVGTDTERYLNDPLYLGHKHKRVSGKEYDDFIEEFFQAVHKRWPNCVVQFEDFGNNHAFDLLERYRSRYCCYNDDIQGTASIVVAGFFSAMKAKNSRLSDEKILFLGAGEAATGVANLIAAAMTETGISREDALSRLYLFDSKGLVTSGRETLAHHKAPFAKDLEPCTDFEECIRRIRPTAIVGLSAQSGAFTESVVKAMAEINERPIIFALSNPTSKAECTAEQAYTWSDGRALFSCGSPFSPVTYKGKTFVPRQGNNSYVFPGIGLGAILGRCKELGEDVFLSAAHTCADMVTPEDLAQGSLYPSLTRVRDISLAVAVNIIKLAFRNGTAQIEQPADIVQYVKDRMYVPNYD